MSKKIGKIKKTLVVSDSTEPGSLKKRLNTQSKVSFFILYRRELVLCLAFAIAILVVYGQVIHYQLINLDDDHYISENQMVQSGLTLKGIQWAFTTFYMSNWHPLTWLSHMLDCQLFGVNTGMYHLVNVIFHTFNTLLLFLFLHSTTKRIWRSAIVAALFALHPLHVESVAWVAERKDMLSTFFGFLTILAYVWYTQAPASWKRYSLVVTGLALGLMAKPMLVTWPFVMLLLDYWPLNRFEWNPTAGWSQFKKALPLIREKIPLFVLVAASSVVTYLAQSAGQAVRTLTDLSLSVRVSNALVSYGKYLLATVWPSGLGVYYPFPLTGIPGWHIVAACIVLLSFTIVVLRAGQHKKYFFVGWFWFLGTLVPVIGLVQVGGQTMADRYTYIPLVGIFVMVVWGFADFAVKKHLPQTAMALATSVILFVCGVLTAIQVSYWKDSVTLLERTLSVTSDNLVIEYNLGHILGTQGQLDRAVVHFSQALRIKPDFYDALINLGMTLSKQGKFQEAMRYFEEASKVQPNSSKPYLQSALALAQSEKLPESLPYFFKALELAPNDPDVHTNLGLVLARQNRFLEAIAHLNEALRLNPNSVEAHNNLGMVFLVQGKLEESILHFSAALSVNPDFALARSNMERAQAQLKAQQNK